MHAGHLFFAFSNFYPCFWGGFYPSFGPPQIAVVYIRMGELVGVWDGVPHEPAPLWLGTWTSAFPVGIWWGYGLPPFGLGFLRLLLLSVMEFYTSQDGRDS